MQSSILLAVENAQNDNFNQALITLITGFIVVFMVLLLLIGIIKLYSTIVYSAQTKAAAKKKEKEQKAEPAPAPVQVADAVQSDEPDLQTIAVIAAAVEAFYGSSKKVRITGIRPSVTTRNEWATAALRENIPAMRSEGLL